MVCGKQSMSVHTLAGAAALSSSRRSIRRGGTSPLCFHTRIVSSPTQHPFGTIESNHFGMITDSSSGPTNVVLLTWSYLHDHLHRGAGQQRLYNPLLWMEVLSTSTWANARVCCCFFTPPATYGEQGGASFYAVPR